jgi:hypothetical protein
MRDEARAKRVLEAVGPLSFSFIIITGIHLFRFVQKHTFDLQAHSDKIARFEEKLRQEKSSVLFPNFLGAKFKDDWERQRRRHEKDNAHKA